jgi:hypothetical protein
MAQYETKVNLSVMKVQKNVDGDLVFVSKICPFRSHHANLNQYYYIMLTALEKNRNRLVYKRDKELVPCTRAMFRRLLDISETTFSTMIRQFCEEGIVGIFQINNREEYYVNPAYAFCGDEIPEFLLWMFKTKPEDLKSFDPYWIQRVKDLRK